MQIETVESDILEFRGDSYQSIATAFLAGQDILLVDSLASADDAVEMQRLLESNGGKVRAVVLTHYMSDHLAGVHLFPGAQVIAHRYYMHTYLSQRQRSAEDDRQFVHPTVLVESSLEFGWGAHHVRIFHNPGKTLCALAIDVPSANLVLCGDAIVGNTVYFSGAAPGILGESLDRLQKLGRRTVIPGHMGRFDSKVLVNAKHYLEAIGSRVRDLRDHFGGPALEEQVRDIPIEKCLAPRVKPTDFEREWHGYNLERIVERRLFFEPAGAAAC